VAPQFLRGVTSRLTHLVNSPITAAVGAVRSVNVRCLAWHIYQHRADLGL